MIPTSYPTAAKMLDVLVSYIKDNKAIQRAVWMEFGWRPSIKQIEDARAVYKNRVEFYTKQRSHKGGGNDNELMMQKDIIRGSQRLKRRILQKHPRIMKAYEAQGLMVKWDD